MQLLQIAEIPARKLLITMPYSHQRNKIRKRNCSSSSSSSLVPSYRFKRAILVGKKGGSSTPVPMWKTTTTTSPSMMATANTHHSQQHSSSKDKEHSMSTRKLAATLWEVDDLPPSRVKKDFEQMKKIRSREKAVSLSGSGIFKPHMSDPSHTPTSERMKGFEGDSYKRLLSGLSRPLHSVDYYSEGVHAHTTATSIEEKNCGKCTVGIKSRLKEARSGLSTSKKLLKVLNQMCIREKQSSTIPLVLALGSELDRVCHLIDKLIDHERSNQSDIEHVVRRFAEEKAAWKRREREKIHEAIKNVDEELKVEKKLRKQTERLNKKIATEMASAKASHLKACKELEREKRAKEILEQICDELARGIGEDRAQVEELKKESEKVRDEVEKEREMLQLADVLREERVQMKLSEAKYQFEEKNDFLEKLRNELEHFMRTKDEETEHENKNLKDLESYFNLCGRGFQNAEKENDFDVGDDVEHEGNDDSDEDGSDLHSIELNMDNENRGYKWNYASENGTQNDSKRVSIDKGSTGRKSYEKIQWGSICFNKTGTTSFKKRDFGINILEDSDHSDPDSSNKSLSGARVHDDKDGTHSNRSIIGFQDSISCANPVRRNGQQLILKCTTSEEAGENVVALEGDNLKQESAGRKYGC